MAAWDVAGDYSRPICRRIVESAGVSRERFGMAKHAASVVLWNRAEAFLPAPDRGRYEAWLRERRREWARAGVVTPFTRRAKDRVIDAALRPVRPLLPIANRVRALDAVTLRVRRIDPRERPDPFFDHLFPWALEDARRRYAE
jgi:hypothetical protein